jgi:SAM-dependent methyltransferase
MGLPLIANVMLLLSVVVGLPFIVLAAGSLVLQRWLAASQLPERNNPYFLYASSNLGSIAGLLSYPICVEPFLGLKSQATAWWYAYMVMIMCYLFCIPPRKKEGRSVPAGFQKVPARSVINWLGLSASGTVALLAVTNVLTFDVASISLLWVLPLSVYLLTFVLVFKRRPWCPPVIDRLFSWVVAIGLALHLMSQLRLAPPLEVAVVLQLALLFVVCMTCHGRLSRLRPDNEEHLTTFYLVLSLGGALGTLLICWIVPLISNGLAEAPGMYLIAAFALWLACKNKEEPAFNIRWAAMAIVLVFAVLLLLPLWLGQHAFSSAIALLIIGAPLLLVVRAAAQSRLSLVSVVLAATVAFSWTEQFYVGGDVVHQLRNYYGIYKVYDQDGIRFLQHGTVQHGRQYLATPQSLTPLSYYHPTTPIGQFMEGERKQLKQIAMIGLGTGALARYTEAGAQFTIYELDPDNVKVAREHFTYLDQSAGDIRMVTGDGRLALRTVADASYDLLVLDAFSSGSIPVHLLTKEAVAEYARVVRPGGMVAMHISNKVLDLQPVVCSIAQELGLELRLGTNDGNVHQDADTTYWAFLAHKPADLDAYAKRFNWIESPWSHDRLPRPWTDQYSDLIGAMWNKGE